MKIKFIFCLILIISIDTEAFPNTEYMVRDSIKDNPKMGFGFSGGWDATYGFGTEISYLIKDNIDFNVGFGGSLNGGYKVGAGSRLFLLTKEGFNFFLIC